MGEGPGSTLSAELLSQWGEGLRSLGMEAVPTLCPHFLAVGPAVPVTGQGSLGSRAVPLGSVPFPQRRQDQPCHCTKVLKSNLPETCHQVRNVRPAGGLGAALRTEDPHTPMRLCLSHVNPVGLGSCLHVPTSLPTVDDTVGQCPHLHPRPGWRPPVCRQTDPCSASPVDKGNLRP